MCFDEHEQTLINIENIFSVFTFSIFSSNEVVKLEEKKQHYYLQDSK